MDSTVASLLSSSSPLELKGEINHESSFIDSSFWHKQEKVPTEFVWPKADLVEAQEELLEPLVDLEGFLKGDEVATQQATRSVRDACLKHGFFEVINHGVDSHLLCAAYEEAKKFFKLPTSQKSWARPIPGTGLGYSTAHAERFSTNLPWKETLSLGFHGNSQEPEVFNFFKSNFGKEFEQTGLIYQKYSKAMYGLSLAILELLAIGLGVDRLCFKNFFEDCSVIMTCNYYPFCQEAGLTLGTGPHRDPTALTILQQDEVAGLDLFTNNRWMSVPPRPGALVIVIGDTFMALSNGAYKSCLHRAVVNKNKDRISLAFFVNPRDDKVVRPPPDLLCSQETRMYPDFTWCDFRSFTQKDYRVDGDTFENFIKRFSPSKSLKPQVI